MEADEQGYKTNDVDIKYIFNFHPYKRQEYRKRISKKKSLREKWNENFLAYAYGGYWYGWRSHIPIDSMQHRFKDLDFIN